MIGGLADLALPFLRTLDPEMAHELTLRAMESGLYPRQMEADDPRPSARAHRDAGCDRWRASW